MSSQTAQEIYVSSTPSDRDDPPGRGRGRDFPPQARPPTDRASGNFVARSVPRRISDPSLSAQLSAPPPFAQVDLEPPESDPTRPPAAAAAEPALEVVRAPTSAPPQPLHDRRELEMTSHLLGGRAGIRLAVRVAPEGHVLESAGNGDGESLGATAAMCEAAVAEAGEMLGLGEIEGWVAMTEGIALYCSRRDDALVTCLGAAQRTAIGHLPSIIDAARGAG